jgi:predicted nuclease of restriction endonuclease-like RecB superfamily
VEIVGFWTPEYLANKLERLRCARVSNLVLCIDADRNLGDGDIPRMQRWFVTAGASMLRRYSKS